MKFKLSDKRGALEILGKRLKSFTEKLKLGGPLTVEFLDEISMIQKGRRLRAVNAS